MFNMQCTCPHLKIGTKVLESRNWNPDCEEHGVDSAWYNSEEETKIRNAQRERTTALQKLASKRRNGELSLNEAKEALKSIEKAYQDATR